MLWLTSKVSPIYQCDQPRGQPDSMIVVTCPYRETKTAYQPTSQSTSQLASLTLNTPVHASTENSTSHGSFLISTSILLASPATEERIGVKSMI
ncbi:hypothetical protein E2C01_009866 [Portunus trituberculatus]|uniref:Uncharacterized protein n=1 Tax=Portunus trituberculatus TaxID=210409 RepID=A0A5B7D6U9_PORTR|nr:hypothetical protein [Portunus trituberculatus]